MEKEIIIKNRLQEFMPNMIELLGKQNISWVSISKRLVAHLAKIREEVNSGINPTYDATFYSIVVRKLAGKGDTDAMFSFYDEVFRSLNKILTIDEKKLIQSMISNILTEFDKNYLNFIGELATLNYFMKTGDYSLINIEEKIHPEKKIKADILLRSKTDNMEILIEVLNLHFEIQEINNFEQLKYYLNPKLEEKVNHKLINPERTIVIQPVIWTKNEEQLRLIGDFYKETGFIVKNVNTPLAYLTYRLPNENFEHKFENIITILD